MSLPHEGKTLRATHSPLAMADVTMAMDLLRAEHVSALLGRAEDNAPDLDGKLTGQKVDSLGDCVRPTNLSSSI